MSESKPRRPDPDPLLTVEQLEADTAARLRNERPVPSRDFSEGLRRLLTSPEPSRPSTTAGPVRAQIAASFVAGVVLLALAAVGVAGAGPFAS